MTKTYALADLHGRFDLLEKAIAEIKARKDEGPYTLIFLGDYVDRGPQSRQIIERLMRGPDDGARWICLKGNHEEMMLTCLAGINPMDWWLDNGGLRTLISYGFKKDDIVDAAIVPEAHKAWASALPTSHIDQHRVYVHGWIDRHIELAQQDPEALIWTRYPSEHPGGYFNKHVIHGHVPYADGPLFRAQRTDLDTLAWKTGRLVVGVFDDATPGAPVDLIEIKGEPQPFF